MKTLTKLHFRSYNKRVVCFTCAFLAIISFCLPIYALEDVQDATDLKHLIKQADKLTRKGSLVEAEKLLRRAVELNPNESKAKLSLTNVLIKQRRFVEAYDLSVAVAKAEPKNARAFALVGMALLNLGSFKDARTVFGSAYELNKDEPLVWFGTGMLDFYENRIYASVPKLERACYLNPNEPDFAFSYAQVLARAEKYEDAADEYKKFLNISPSSDADRRARIKGLISFLQYLGARTKLYEISSDVDQTTVPISLYNLRPIIEIGIGDKKEKFRFVLDTGSGISVISSKTTKKLNIKPVARGGSGRGIGGDGKFEIVYGFLNKISIGDTSIRNVPMYIRDFDDNNENVDGYIGLSLISKFLTTVDYGNLTFTLKKKENNIPIKPGVEDLALPLRLTSSGFLSGEVQIEGIQTPLNFIVDTGANISVISDDLASTSEIRKFVTKEKIQVYGAAGVTEDLSTFLLPKVSFGKHTRERVRAVALDLDMINEAAGFEQAGILGANFLINYRVTFDFQNSKVTFVPIAAKR